MRRKPWSQLKNTLDGRTLQNCQVINECAFNQGVLAADSGRFRYNLGITLSLSLFSFQISEIFWFSREKQRRSLNVSTDLTVSTFSPGQRPPRWHRAPAPPQVPQAALCLAMKQSGVRTAQTRWFAGNSNHTTMLWFVWTWLCNFSATPCCWVCLCAETSSTTYLGPTTTETSSCRSQSWFVHISCCLTPLKFGERRTSISSTTITTTSLSTTTFSSTSTSISSSTSTTTEAEHAKHTHTHTRWEKCPKRMNCERFGSPLCHRICWCAGRWFLFLSLLSHTDRAGGFRHTVASLSQGQIFRGSCDAGTACCCVWIWVELSLFTIDGPSVHFWGARSCGALLQEIPLSFGRKEDWNCKYCHRSRLLMYQKISKVAALVKDFPLFKAVVPRCWNIYPTGIVVPMLTWRQP